MGEFSSIFIGPVIDQARYLYGALLYVQSRATGLSSWESHNVSPAPFGPEAYCAFQKEESKFR